MSRTKERVDHSAEGFLKVPGWLCLRLSKSGTDQKREEWIHEGEKRWIVSGFWIHPKAVSILRDGNEIDGVIMDTTFTVMRQYHAAILMAVSHNVGIPLALSFGPKKMLRIIIHSTRHLIHWVSTSGNTFSNPIREQH
jgi:hypothetical protein